MDIFRSLSLQNRRKFPDLVNAAEHGVLNLRSYQSQIDLKRRNGQDISNIPHPLHSDSIIRPFLLVTIKDF